MAEMTDVRAMLDTSDERRALEADGPEALHVQRHRHRHVVGRPLPAARVLGHLDRRRAGRRAPATPRCGRAGGPCRRRSSRASDSSTRCRASPARGTNVRATSIQSPAFCAAVSFSHSIGVCDTTLSSALWLQTSCSSGATLRSPTTIERSSRAGSMCGHSRSSSRNDELVREFRIDLRDRARRRRPARSNYGSSADRAARPSRRASTPTWRQSVLPQ